MSPHVAPARRAPRRLAVAALAGAGLAAACAPEGPAVPSPARTALEVRALSYPLAWCAERLAGDLARVELPAPPDVDPAHWSPEREALRELQTADLVLANGAGHSAWLERAALPLAALVDTSAGLADRLIPEEGAVRHSHGPEGAHEHGGTAFTLWLDPTLLAAQARAVRDALAARVSAEDGRTVAGRCAALEEDLRRLDELLREAFGRAPGAALLASHPVYQYLARAYGLDLRSLHWEPDEVPDAAQWEVLDGLLRERAAGVMLWEAEPAAATRSGLAQRGVVPVVFDPCGSRPAAGDYLEIQRENARRVAAALDDLGD